MEEDFLHYIWKFGLFDQTKLRTTEGETVKVVRPGLHNFDSGPDFFNARVRIGKNTWAGNVEIHVKASDWLKHKHQQDKAYQSVVLHVVHTADHNTQRQNQENIPTLEFKNRIPKKIYAQYIKFKKSSSKIPCSSQLKLVPPIRLLQWLDRLLAERLELKAEPIIETLQHNRNHWEQTFFIHLAKGMGMKVNAQPFEMLARSTPISIINKYRNKAVSLEALLFGQAGFLSPSKELPFEDREVTNYYFELKKEYAYLKKKHSLSSIPVHLWKFMRLRPSGFPTIRISQLASLLYGKSNLFSKVLDSKDPVSLQKLLEAAAHPYWNDHYRFGVPGKRSGSKKIGPDLTNHLLINSIAPFLFIYGKEKGNESLKESSLNILAEIPAENNAVIRTWKSAGIKALNAGESQALIQLHKFYCTPRRCLDCQLGVKFLS